MYKNKLKEMLINNNLVGLDKPFYINKKQNGGFLHHITNGVSNMAANTAVPLIQLSMAADKATNVLKGNETYHKTESKDVNENKSKNDEGKITNEDNKSSKKDE